MERYKKKFKEETSSHHYEANIHFDVHEDDYEQGEGKHVNSFTDKFKDKTLEGLLKRVANEVNAKSIKEFYCNNINDYGDSTELWYEYMVDDPNTMRPAEKKDIQLWTQGKKKLYVVGCHIRLSSVGKTAVDVGLLRKFGIKEM